MLTAHIKRVKLLMRLLLNKHALARSVHCMYVCYRCEKSEMVVFGMFHWLHVSLLIVYHV